MMLESLGKGQVFLSADDHLHLALFLSNQSKTIKWLKGWLPPDYDHKNIYSLLTRLRRRQLVSQTGRGQFRLSAIGRDRLFRLYPLLAARPQTTRFAWVQGRPAELGYFFTAIVDFGGYMAPNVFLRRRMELVKVLQRWGWGRLTRGVYLSGSRPAAAALTKHLAAFRLTELVTLGMLAITENQNRLIDRMFNLSARNADWRLIIDRINEQERIGEPEKGLRLIRKDFLILLVTEPPVPRDLLPEPYWMEEAVGIISNN